MLSCNCLHICWPSSSVAVVLMLSNTLVLYYKTLACSGGEAVCKWFDEKLMITSNKKGHGTHNGKKAFHLHLKLNSATVFNGVSNDLVWGAHDPKSGSDLLQIWSSSGSRE